MILSTPGETLKHYRTIKNLTVKDLCALLKEKYGVNWEKYKVNRLENGTNSLKPDEIVLLSKALGITPNILLGFGHEMEIDKLKKRLAEAEAEIEDLRNFKSNIYNVFKEK